MSGDVQRVEKMVAEGKITAAEAGELLESLGIDRHAPAASRPPPMPQDAIPARLPFTAESVQTQFVWLTIGWWIGLPLATVVDLLPNASVLLKLLLSIIFLPALVVATVFGCILMYRQWLLLQGHGARTTPGKAVGFSFIPFFCFYWWFVAYAGLATDTNNYLRRIGATAVRMSFGLAVADTILTILACTVGFIPWVGALLNVPAAIIGFILLLQQRNCVLAMLAARAR
jgi:hypothetical protein